METKALFMAIGSNMGRRHGMNAFAQGNSSVSNSRQDTLVELFFILSSLLFVG